ncbi:hypothetical protein HDE_05706 [Halotydeus destructor]|nr:hypothetical protein HDE_05706 [Halotydeus destructor]
MKSLKAAALILICICGFAYQAYEICSVYFSYPSSYSVGLTMSRNLQVPSFTLCLPHHMSTSEFTVSEISSEMAPNVVIECRLIVFSDTGQLVNRSCSSLGQYQYYIYNTHWCLNYRVNNALWTRRSLAAKERIYTIGLPDHVGTAFLLTHQNGRYVSTKLNYMALRTSLSAYHFRVISVRRLPPPYQGDCYRYGLEDMVSADHCLDQCVAYLSIRELNEWPHDVAASSDVNLTISATDSNDYIIRCEDKCARSECDHNQHSAAAHFGDTKNGVRFRIVSSPEFDLVSTELAKFQLIELICYVASLTGFWFGSSVLTLGRTVLQSVTQRKRVAELFVKRTNKISLQRHLARVRSA